MFAQNAEISHQRLKCLGVTIDYPRSDVGLQSLFFGPEEFDMKTLGPIGIEAFERRSISAETAARFAIYTASRAADGTVIPDGAGNIVVFPFIEHGAVVNEKYRGPGKKFWQRNRRTSHVLERDALDDPALETGQLSLVITEGELDAIDRYRVWVSPFGIRTRRRAAS